MHNEKGRAQQQAEPLNEGLVRDLLKPRATGLRDIRNKAILVVGYVTLCRRAELVALQFADLAIEPDGFGTIMIRRSKSDQEGRGATVPIPADAMRYVTRWVDAAGITNGALFRAVRYSESVGGPLSPVDVARVYKAMAARAGLSDAEVARISGHSTRVGGAQDLMRYKEQMAGIMAAGRWKSAEMVGRYTAKVGRAPPTASRESASRSRRRPLHR